ncbi:MAG: hypothetical protein RJA57_1086 [Bacteroidota bacterium]
MFDFHLHPSLKAQFADPSRKPAPWEDLHLRFRNPDLMLRLLRCQGINEVIDSQASMTQVARAGMNLVAITLHPPEAAMMRDPLIQKIAAEAQTPFIHPKQVARIAGGDACFELLNEELAHLLEYREGNGYRLKLIRSMDEYDAGDTRTIHAVLNIEGAHAFEGIRTGRNSEERWRTYWENFTEFTTARGVRIFAMNIAHLEPNECCNHAFGIQVFRPEPFYPTGCGITPMGVRLLHQMRDQGILCDIKHTSLLARQQLYALGLHGDGWPLVCTHAGLTGIHSNERTRYIRSQTKLKKDFLHLRHSKPAGYLEGTSFNASSINLYDDDVAEVVLSGGLIGLSLDQRILGTPEQTQLSGSYTDELYDEEVISPEERDFFLTGTGRYAGPEAVSSWQHISTRDRQEPRYFHARHFLNQVFHLFRIADRYSIPCERMAQQICIGSDFDGLIDPLNACRTVLELPAFRNDLLNEFVSWERAYTAATGQSISTSIPPDELLENIFYANGVRFMRAWYT